MLSTIPAAFTDQQVKLLLPAANQVSASINSAELYQLIRDQAERMGSLLRSEQEEAQKNSAILEAIADGVMSVDSQGKIVLFNAAAERILGIERNRVLGSNVSALSTWPEGIATIWEDLINEWSNAEELLDDTHIEEFTIGARIFRLQLSPVFIGNNVFLGVVSVFREI